MHIDYALRGALSLNYSSIENQMLLPEIKRNIHRSSLLASSSDEQVG